MSITKIEKDSDDFWCRRLTLKLEFWHFLTPSYPQNSIYLFLCACWFLDKNLSNFVSAAWKLNCITIMLGLVLQQKCMNVFHKVVNKAFFSSLDKRKKFVTQKKHPFKFHEVQVGRRSLAATGHYDTTEVVVVTKWKQAPFFRPASDKWSTSGFCPISPIARSASCVWVC